MTFQLILIISTTFCYVMGDNDTRFLFFGCDRNINSEYHTGQQEFSTRLFKKVAKHNGNHFALSQYSIWLSLSAIAEGTIESNHQDLLKLLNLPQRSCLREKYYDLATSIESSAEDVTISRRRLLLLDRNLVVNMTWAYGVRASGLVDPKITSLTDEKFTNHVRELTGMSNFKVEGGNAAILDALDYEGLWTEAFQNSTEEVDFFDDSGVKIGTVEMMKMKKRVKLLSIPLMGAKMLELPVGNAGRFKMIFVMATGKNPIERTIENFPNTLMIDALDIILESAFPLEVGIPKFRMESLIDLKEPLKEMGFESLWRNDANVLISTPPAAPSTIVQRVSVTLNPQGVQPSMTKSLATIFGRGFYANRPFIYGLVDADTRTWLFSGVFSRP